MAEPYRIRKQSADEQSDEEEEPYICGCLASRCTLCGCDEAGDAKEEASSLRAK